ncbi:LOW QUALITY PROTEIN: uncharacterized protein LOC116399339 [Xyrichtys novacula]|uniref:LOW QUALITY PROTEIN: uncharacterized protein LOC116399339 n=1 Tax=Xyrichtys novacula TaxID=13765 RepID=A0AAV1H7R9_XYRNO|nr:LOW QUALITY PROTEIN: uncharacterized protein LOC116399339 [Xyrichtys novacula]
MDQSLLDGDVVASSAAAAGAPMAPTRPPGGAPGPSSTSSGALAACRLEDRVASALLATSSRASPGAGAKNTSLPAHSGIPVWPGTGGGDPSPSVPGRARCPGTRLDHRSESRPASSAARRRFLRDAVRRNSAGPVSAAPDRSGRPSPQPLASTVSTAPLSPRTPTTSPASDTGAMHPPPLFPPTTLIIGDSIIRGIRYFNAITRSFPGATVADITAKLPGLLQSLPASIHRIIVHRPPEAPSGTLALTTLTTGSPSRPQLVLRTIPIAPTTSSSPSCHPPGYSYLHQPRLTGRGGGVAVIYKQTLKTTPAPTLSLHSFENISVKLPGPTPLVIVTIYRPPKPHPSFLSDFSEFVTHLNTISSSVLLLGDFNFHIDNPTCKQASDFLDLLDTLNLTQHVHSPTHSHGHTLDLVCSTGISIHHLSTTNLYISDHLAVTFNVDLPLCPTVKNDKLPSETSNSSHHRTSPLPYLPPSLHPLPHHLLNFLT